MFLFAIVKNDCNKLVESTHWYADTDGMSLKSNNKNHPYPQIEWPTYLIAAVVYGGWLALTWYSANLPGWLLLPLGGMLLCLHGSLQHECVHGHPSHRRRWISTLLGGIPLALWLPFKRYRDSHLEHHRTPALTHPELDPESFYVTSAHWQQMSNWQRSLLRANSYLVGRLVLGPWLMVITTWKREFSELSPRLLQIWLPHCLAVLLVLIWVTQICELPLWEYVGLFIWPGLAATLLRSYAEHRPHTNPKHRTITVGGGYLPRLLFLNNNLHREHHANPQLAWYQLRPEATHPSQLSYPKLFRHYFLQPLCSPIYPEAADLS